MNTVVIDGVTYTKASTLAKKYDYTTDYLGQLARAEKVSAQLVGRSWYIDESSLRQHSSKRVEAVAIKEKLLDRITIEPSQHKIAITKPLTKSTTRFTDLAKQNKPESRHVDVHVRYEPDEIELLPSLAKLQTVSMTPPTAIAVELAESSKIEIGSVTKNSKISFTEIPAVQLQGKVRVSAVENPVHTTAVLAPIEPKIPEKTTLKSSSLPQATPVSQSDKKSVASNIPNHTPAKHKPVFTPKSLQTVRTNSQVTPLPARSGVAVTFVRLSFYTFLMLVFFLIATLQLQVVALNGDTVTSLKFSASLLNR
jgi:hypothetical protein